MDVPRIRKLRYMVYSPKERQSRWMDANTPNNELTARS